MKISRFLLTLSMISLLIVIAVPSTTNNNTDSRSPDQVSYPEPTLPNITKENIQSQSEGMAPESVKFNTLDGSEQVEIEQSKFGMYQVKTWHSIAHLLPSMDYPRNAKVLVTEDNELRIMTKSSWTGESDMITENIPSLELLEDNFQKSEIPFSVGHLNLNQYQSNILGIKNSDLSMMIEPDFFISTDFTPNDLDTNNQWAIPALGLQTAWDTQLGNKSLKIAVLDTGIDYNHPDLDDNYLNIGYDWVNDDSDPFDDNHHGTHVAGTIAAEIDNGIGVVGVANVSIFAEKILDASGSGSYSAGVNAIYHAVDQGANILSNSWGGDVYSQNLQDAVNYAAQNNVLVIAASGNDGQAIDHYPASLDNVISVGSLDEDLTKSSFSNYGSSLDIVAPGRNIYSTFPGSTYSTISGTSMATPHVSGVAALYWSQFGDLTAQELESLLYVTAQDLGDPGYDTSYGYGMVYPDLSLGSLPEIDLSPRLEQIGYDSEAGDKDFMITITNFGNSTATNVNVSVYLDGSIIDDRTILSIGPLEAYEYSKFVEDGWGEGNYNLTVNIEAYPNETGSMINSKTVFLQDMQILNGFNEIDVSGAYVPVNFELQDYNQLESIEYFNNGNFVTSFLPLGYLGIFYLPIMQNGTQDMDLHVTWNDGTYVDLTFWVNATDVVPLADFQVGDYFDWVYNDSNPQRQKYTVNEIISPSTVNLTIYVENWDSNGNVVESFTLWAIMNTYNGLYELTNFGFDGERFQFFTNIKMDENIIGSDIIGFSSWDIDFTVDAIYPSSTNSDQLIVGASISNAAYNYTYPQNLILETEGINSNYMLDSTYLPEDTGVDLSIIDGIDRAETTYEIKLTNTGDFIEEIQSLDISYNGKTIDYTITSDFTDQSNTSLLYPGTSYTLITEDVSDVNGQLDVMLTTSTQNGDISYSTSGEVSIVDNTAPEINYIGETPIVLTQGDTIIMSYNIVDDFIDHLTLSVNDNVVSDIEFNDSTFSYEFIAQVMGSHVVNVTAIDQSGNAASLVLDVVVEEGTSSSESSTSVNKTSERTTTSSSQTSDETDPDTEAAPPLDLNFPAFFSMIAILGLIAINRIRRR